MKKIHSTQNQYEDINSMSDHIFSTSPENNNTIDSELDTSNKLNEKINITLEILKIANKSNKSIQLVVDDFQKCFTKIDTIMNGILIHSKDKKKLTKEDIMSTISDDYIICLEDNKKYQSLTRHLSSKYFMTPEEYRLKWNLPHDYPMVAKNYTEKRKKIITDIHRKKRDNI